MATSEFPAEHEATVEPISDAIRRYRAQPDVPTSLQQSQYDEAKLLADAWREVIVSAIENGA